MTINSIKFKVRIIIMKYLIKTRTINIQEKSRNLRYHCYVVQRHVERERRDNNDGDEEEEKKNGNAEI